MKKSLALIIALLMILSAAALAETTLTEYAVIPEDIRADAVGGSHLLSLDNGNSKALATLDGTPLTDYLYYSFTPEYGWVVAAVANDDQTLSRGLLASDGTTVIPVEYDDVDVLSENWAVGVRLEPAEEEDSDYRALFGDGYYKITTVDIYNLTSGAMVATLSRDDYGRAKAYDQYLNVTDRTNGVTQVYDATFTAIKEVGDYFDTSMVPDYTTFNDNGMQGLKAPDGTVILEPTTYKMINTDVKDGYFMVSDYDHYGLCDLSGKLVVPMEYKTISLVDSAYVNYGYASVKTDDDRIGFVNVDTGETFITDYTTDDCYSRGLTVDIAEGEGMDRSFTIVSADGVVTHLDHMQSLLPIACGYLYKPCNSDGNSGMIDWHGNEILPCEYSSITVTDDLQYVITQYSYRDPVKVYKLDDGFLFGDAPAAEAAPEAEPAADAGQLSDDAPAPEAAAVEDAEISDQEEAAPAADSPAIAELINSAITLLKADPAANSTAAVSLIHSVATQISGNDTVLAQLNSVITLLNDNPAANGAAAITLLESLIPLL